MKQILILFMLCIQSLGFAQGTYTIQGHFPNFPNSQYELKGYTGLDQTTIATAKSKEEGKFTLTYPATYVGNAPATARLYPRYPLLPHDCIVWP
jgi:hypothetical protein